MKSFSQLTMPVGRLAFSLGLPVLRMALNGSRRSRVIVRVGDEILLIKPWLGSGDWMLPGGGIGRGEDPAIAAARELREESGIRVEPSRLKSLGTVPFSQHGLAYANVCYYTKLPSKPRVFSEHFLEIADHVWVPALHLPADCSPEVAEALALAGVNVQPGN